METITLKNGVVIEVEDKTSVLSGDLHLIHLEFTTQVRLGVNDAELKRYCKGDLLEKTRVFKKSAVHERDLDETRNSMKDSYLASTIPYMEHPKFIVRFKLRSLEEFREEERKKARRQKGRHEERK